MGVQSAETLALEARNVLHSTNHSVDHDLPEAADKVKEAGSRVAPATKKIADVASAALGTTKDTLRASTDQLRQQAVRASHLATGYTRDEPLKAMLIAAGVGALLMAIVSLLGRRD